MKNIITISLLFLVCGCSSDNEIHKPTNLMEQDLFIDVLTEIQIAESGFLKSTDKPTKKKEKLALDTKSILNDFEVDAAAFDSSMLYYQQDLPLLMAIYDSVIIRLENKLADMENNKAKKD